MYMGEMSLSTCKVAMSVIWFASKMPLRLVEVGSHMVWRALNLPHTMMGSEVATSGIKIILAVLDGDLWMLI